MFPLLALAGLGATVGTGIAGAGLIGAGLDIAAGVSQHSANQQAVEMANRNMRWQREMAETAIQKRVKDLQAAGLSPMLAYQGMGAAQATGGTSIPEIKSAPASAAQVRLNRIAAENAEADIAVKHATAENQRSQARLNDFQSGERGQAELGNMMAMRQQIEANTALSQAQKEKVIKELGQVEEQTRLIVAQMHKTAAEAGKVELEKMEVIARTRFTNLESAEKEAIMPSLIQLYRMRETLTGYQMPKAELDAKAYDTWWRKMLAWMGFTNYEADKVIEAGNAAISIGRKP